MNENINSSTFVPPALYMTAEEQDTVMAICNIARKNPDSRKHLSYIVTYFSNYIKKSPISATYTDITSYISFLQSQQHKKLLTESYCYVIFCELRSFFSFGAQLQYLPNGSLFDSIPNPFHWTYSSQMDALPSLEDLDLLLSLTSDNLFLSLAVLFAFRMALPVSEIVKLRRSDVVQNENDGLFYLKALRYIDELQQDAYLLIPDDVLPLIRESVCTAAANDTDPYLIRSLRRRATTIRTLQHTLSVVQADTELHITFSKLRSMGIYIMMISNVPFESLCSYVNLAPAGNWFLTKPIPDRLCLDASSYVHIRIV